MDPVFHFDFDPAMVTFSQLNRENSIAHLYHWCIGHIYNIYVYILCMDYGISCRPIAEEGQFSMRLNDFDFHSTYSQHLRF